MRGTSAIAGWKTNWNGLSADVSSRNLWSCSVAALSVTFYRNETMLSIVRLLPGVQKPMEQTFANAARLLIHSPILLAAFGAPLSVIFA